MPGKICKGNGLSETCCHLSEVRARRLRLDRVNALGLISSQFHRFPPKTWNRGTPWNSRSTPGSLAAQGLRGNRGTVEQNFQKLPRNLHTYILLEQMSIYMYALIYAVFFVPQFHTPPKKWLKALRRKASRCGTCVPRTFLMFHTTAAIHPDLPRHPAPRWAAAGRSIPWGYH